MSGYRHLISLGRYLDNLPIPPPMENQLVGHTLRIERDVITSLLRTHRDQQEYFFSVPPNTMTLTRDDLFLIRTGWYWDTRRA